MKKKQTMILENLIDLLVEDGLEDAEQKPQAAATSTPAPTPAPAPAPAPQEPKSIPSDQAGEEEKLEQVKFLETPVLFTTNPPVDSSSWPQGPGLYLNPLKKGLVGADLVKVTKPFFKFSGNAAAAQYSKRQFRIRLRGVFSFDATIIAKISKSKNDVTANIVEISADTPVGKKNFDESKLSRIKTMQIQGDHSHIVGYEKEKESRETLPDEETIKSTMEASLDSKKSSEKVRVHTRQVIDLIRDTITGKSSYAFTDLKINLDDLRDMDKVVDFAEENIETTGDQELTDLIINKFFKEEQKIKTTDKQKEVLRIAFERIKNETGTPQEELWKGWNENTLLNKSERRKVLNLAKNADDSNKSEVVADIADIIKNSWEKQESLDLQGYLRKILVEAELDKKEQEEKREKKATSSLISEIAEEINTLFGNPPSSITAGSKKTIFEGQLFEFFETEKASIEISNRKKTSNNEFKFQGKIKCDGYLWVDARIESQGPTGNKWTFRIHDEPSKPFLIKRYMI